MKLATLKSSSRDGELILVDQQQRHCVKATGIAANLREAIENWSTIAPQLQQRSQQLNQGKCSGTFTYDPKKLHSPLPRSFSWMDGSAYIQHIILVRKARNAEIPPTLRTVPLMYQGGSDSFLAPHDPIPYQHPDYGLDFESEVGVIVGDVPMGTTAAQAHKYILLCVLINDVTLRGLVPAELAQGFGFLQSKPSSAFAPLALTPDELGNAFRDGRVHLPLHTRYNGAFFGDPDAGEMHFSFYDLIAHAARTRPLAAGTIIGSGTVSNEDEARGHSCLAEKRMLEKIKTGDMHTPFMSPNDTIEISMQNSEGQDLFGTISQRVANVAHTAE